MENQGLRPNPLKMTTGPDSTSLVSDEERRDCLASPSSPSTASPRSPTTPKSPFRFSTKKSYQKQRDPIQAAVDLQSNQSSTSQSAPSGRLSIREEKENRPIRGGLFSNYKASKSRLQPPETIRKVSKESMSRGDSEDPVMLGNAPLPESKRSESADRSIARKPVGSQPLGSPSKSETSLASPKPSNNDRKHKPKLYSLLPINGETDASASAGQKSYTEASSTAGQRGNQHLEPKKSDMESDQPLRTAPLRQESGRSFREMFPSTARHHSEDRKNSTVRDNSSTRGETREYARQQPGHASRESSSHAFFNNLKTSASKGAGAISKGIFGKSGRSDSTNAREPPVVDDKHYEIKVLNKPLVEQTRLTRISKRLENSSDKTEFWMPAFPWRAIDYLNYKGSEVEGLYRVPGSGPQIKKWQRRFDEELDINLFEQDDLCNIDINIIGSMLKTWLRELPDEVLPKAVQDRVARECTSLDKVPQILVDELSNLSPFNYYLLFAITCHLWLLLANSEQTKMDFRNLCICFQPCIRIDARCFKWLVCDWRDCWKGCKAEGPYIDQEYALFDKPTPSRKSSHDGYSSTAVDHSHDERNVSSSDSSKPSSVSVNNHGRTHGKDNRQVSNIHGQPTISTSNANLTPVQETPPRNNSNDMRPLSPIKPLSPIGF